MSLLTNIKVIRNFPKVGEKITEEGQALYVQATGVYIKRQPVTGQYYLEFKRDTFIAKNRKGEFFNCKIIK